jgi:hypothetical protein
MFKSPQEFADAAKGLIPTINVNKNGYEIRTQVLGMAKDHMDFQFGAKFQEWENTIKRDPESGHIINKVKMPVIPGVDEILKTAEKFYDFVNNTSVKK